VKRLVTILFLLSFALVDAKGQDMQFSQFYAAPLYINPAFTGQTIEHRMILNYRNQWPAIPNAFQAYHATYEYNAAEINSGFGLIFNREEAGSFGLTSDILALSYSYRIALDRKHFIQTGLKFGYVWRSLDFNSLVFNDQLERDIPLTADEDAFLDDNVNYPDISWGALFYNDHYWVGTSINHINEPNQSLLEDAGQTELPLKWSVHSGYRFELSGSTKSRTTRELFTAIHYKSQGKFDQVDLGAYLSQGPFVFGFWYRGIPILKRNPEAVMNNDAIVALLGLTIPDRNLRIGYSYDVTISRLISDSGGAHEISLIYEVAGKHSKRRNKRFLAPCAKF
jgi:type IX secretion system PorP/SprF family membrane protein